MMMKILPLLLSVFIASALSLGCNDPVPQPSTNLGGWTRADVENKTLVYERPNGLDKSFYFSDGTVAVTLLTVGQPPVAPLLYWTINSDGYLLVSTYKDMTDAKRTRIVHRVGDDLVLEREDGTKYSVTYSP